MRTAFVHRTSQLAAHVFLVLDLDSYWQLSLLSFTFAVSKSIYKNAGDRLFPAPMHHLAPSDVHRNVYVLSLGWLMT